MHFTPYYCTILCQLYTFTQQFTNERHKHLCKTYLFVSICLLVSLFSINLNCFFLILFSLAVLVITWTISDFRLFSAARSMFCRLLSFRSNCFCLNSSNNCLDCSFVFCICTRSACFFSKLFLSPLVLLILENLEKIILLV